MLRTCIRVAPFIIQGSALFVRPDVGI